MRQTGGPWWARPSDLLYLDCGISQFQWKGGLDECLCKPKLCRKGYPNSILPYLWQFGIGISRLGFFQPSLWYVLQKRLIVLQKRILRSPQISLILISLKTDAKGVLMNQWSPLLLTWSCSRTEVYSYDSALPSEGLLSRWVIIVVWLVYWLEACYLVAHHILICQCYVNRGWFGLSSSNQ